jgi:hypothetical protein
MALTWPDKDPNEVLDYSVDWTERLEDDDTITASEWIVPEAGINMDSDDFADSSTTIWLSGGTAGKSYSFTNRIITTQGRTIDQTIQLKVRDR